jgi:DNA-directed RNA polymerase specialized sigma24 family protein
MQRKDTIAIITYYRAIPGMEKLLKEEQRELENEYCGLRAVSMDGMPHGSFPGKPVEALSIAMEASGDADRLREIERRVQELEGDKKIIRGALDAVCGRYKTILSMRYLYGYSWGKISARMGVPDSTVRHWESKAVSRFGKVMEEVTSTKDILGRASRARV